jgi:hypothetical protein
MRKIVASAFLFIGLTGAFAQTVADSVRTSFEGYKKAILETRGADAVKFVDQETVAYYGKMLDLTRHADSATVSHLGLMDKLFVFTSRAQIKSSELRKLSGQGYFVYAVDHGMIGKNSVSNNGIGNVEANGNEARGKIMSRGQEAGLSFTFHREDKIWKLNLISILPPTEAALKKMLADKGMDENAFIFSALQSLTGKPVDPSIWKAID